MNGACLPGNQTRTELERLVEERTQELLQNEQRLQALLAISQYQARDVQDLLDYALEKVVGITASQIGYIYHYFEERQEFVLNTWSREVMPACRVASPQSVYQLEKTGIWGEAVRQRRTILINDFAAENPLKKGYPEGHVHLSRFLTVPVFDTSGQIVAVVGVANKQEAYTSQDVQQLELMLTEVWRISKRLELEQRLVQAGRDWQTTFDAISDSVALLDRDQRVLRCNQASTRLFKRGFGEIIGRYCYELVHGLDHPIDSCPMQRAMISRRSESRLVFEHGRWLQVTVDPLLDGQGQVTGVVHIVHDDTERVLSEQAQLELLSMLEAVQNELYVFSPETLRFEYVNRSAQLNLGYSMQQLLQMTPLDLKTGIGAQEFMQLLQPLLSGERPLLQFEQQHRRADGSCYPVEVNLQLVETRSGKRCLAVIHDISQRIQAEQQLASANERLISASEAANIALWSWDILNGTLDWSRSVDRMLGAAPGSFPRTVAVWEEIIHPDDREPIQQALTSHFEQQTPYEVDYRVRSADGSWLDWHDSGRAVFDASGKPVSMSGACIDITSHKQAELRIRELQAQLLQSDKMASIGQLSAGIAHEINNPMGFINSNLGALDKYIDRFERYITGLEAALRHCGQPAEQQAVAALRASLKMDYVQRDIHQLLAESTEGAERVMQIVKDLKTFARSDTARTGRADINQCLDSTINIIWNQIKYVAELKREYGELPTVSCNIQQVNQVFMNLLVNAAHAIEQKGAEGLGAITVRTWLEDAQVCIAVSDTGCGITDDQLRRIFEPFFTTKEVGKGTGLGLSISYEIIKKHGGEITVQSAVGAGSTFTIRLPLNGEADGQNTDS